MKKKEEKWSSRYAYLCWFDELISDEKLDLKKKKKSYRVLFSRHGKSLWRHTR
jgi:hypothetical protein